MLKKVLHTAVAAVAVSTICLSAADAAPPKKDLILDFEAMSYDFVGWSQWQRAMGGECGDCDYPNPVESNQIRYEQGTMSFGGKTVEAFRSNFYPGVRHIGTHAVCGPDSETFDPIQASILLRGDDKKNTITLATVPLAESQDMTNPDASGWCMDAFGRPKEMVINYQISDATNNWRCAYIEEQTVRHVGSGETVQYPKSMPFYASSWGHDSRDVTDHQGTLVIPAPDCY